MEISEIKKNVTHFSLELEKATQEEEVVVGGELKAIVPPADEQNRMHILLLDDQVGVVHVFVSDLLLTAYWEQLKIGNTVFVEGYASFVTRKQGKSPGKEAFVYGYALKEVKQAEGIS